MSSSDDDIPPPLEDMSEQLQANKIAKEKAEGNLFGGAKTADHTEEVRLAPKKETVAEEKKQPANVSKIAPKEDFDFDKKPAPKKEQPAAKKKNQGFGGFAAGFLNAKPPAKKQQQAKPAAQENRQIEANKPKIEDMTHVKAKAKDDNLKFAEVQEAMTNTLEKNKNEWMTPEFFNKLAQNPKLLKAFQNPEYMAALSEMGKNPQEAMQKYGNNPEFRELMQEFSMFMGNHFEGVADKKKAEEEEERKEEERKRKEEEERMKDDPVYKIIQTDPQVKAYLEDPEVKKILEHLRFQGGLDLHEIMRTNPTVGQKMMFLLQRGVLNAQSAL